MVTTRSHEGLHRLIGSYDSHLGKFQRLTDDEHSQLLALADEDDSQCFINHLVRSGANGNLPDIILLHRMDSKQQFFFRYLIACAECGGRY